MMKPVFVIDLDGVLLNMSDVWCDWLSKRYETNIPMAIVRIQPKHITSWDLHDAFGLSSLNKLWEYTWNTPLKPYDGAQAFVEAISQAYTPYVVSNRRSGAAVEAGVRDIQAHFPNLAFKFVEEEKGPVLKQLAPIAFLDDRMKNLFDAHKAVPGTRLFLLNRPWNHSLELEAPWERVSFYTQVLERMNG